MLAKPFVKVGASSQHSPMGRPRKGCAELVRLLRIRRCRDKTRRSLKESAHDMPNVSLIARAPVAEQDAVHSHGSYVPTASR